MLKTRKEKIQFIKDHIQKVGSKGLEISPNISPMITPDDEFDMDYLDVCSTEQLRARAISKGRDPNFAPIINHLLDFKKPISECVGGRKYDFVLTSHVIEHIPDLIGHFIQVQNVLNPGGTYAFLAPDKNLCFDHLKPDTSLGQLIEAHVEKRTVTPLRAMIDEYYYGVKRDGKGAWNIDEQKPIHPKYGNKHDLIKKVLVNHDRANDWHGHIWNFTPESFKSIYLELGVLGLVNLGIKSILPTYNMEFIVVLQAS